MRTRILLGTRHERNSPCTPALTPISTRPPCAWDALKTRGEKPKRTKRTWNCFGNGGSRSKSALVRWVDKKWVNVCVPRNEQGKVCPCGRHASILCRSRFPYCRPSVRVPAQAPKIVGEMSTRELNNMCKRKRRLEPDVDGRPTRVHVSTSKYALHVPCYRVRKSKCGSVEFEQCSWHVGRGCRPLADSREGEGDGVEGEGVESGVDSNDDDDDNDESDGRQEELRGDNGCYHFVPLTLAEEFESLAALRGVSKVARGRNTVLSERRWVFRSGETSPWSSCKIASHANQGRERANVVAAPMQLLFASSRSTAQKTRVRHRGRRKVRRNAGSSGTRNDYVDVL